MFLSIGSRIRDRMTHRNLEPLRTFFESKVEEINALATAFRGPTPTSAILIRHLQHTAEKIGADADFLQQINDERTIKRELTQPQNQSTTPIRIVGRIAMYEGSKRMVNILNSIGENLKVEIEKSITSGDRESGNLLGTMEEGLFERTRSWRKIRDIISFIQTDSENSIRLAGEMIKTFTNSKKADSFIEELELLEKCGH